MHERSLERVSLENYDTCDGCTAAVPSLARQAPSPISEALSASNFRHPPIWLQPERFARPQRFEFGVYLVRQARIAVQFLFGCRDRTGTEPQSMIEIWSDHIIAVKFFFNLLSSFLQKSSFRWSFLKLSEVRNVDM